ncbi:hypothetical protein MetMK1DRAFT_00003230 [Metallosphaera yellowstonensis MK1]|jgi:hypothetical protein|uniref:Uncharacterized protein n=2 Tax=Metallosphaera TaxID=41980 RepID=H2C4F6_9CREN|nr:hypothetical protein MetMK1DRAFT_00003230 [Metallosphaera yellowstonensis MK1]
MGKRTFFCCEHCARGYKNVIQEVLRRTGWDRLDSLELEGNYRGRKGVARNGDKSYVFSFRLGSEAEITEFREEDSKS